MGTRYYDLFRAGKLKMPDEDTERRFLRADAGTDPEGRPAGLRNFQPRPARAGEPPQPDLLALWRVCRRRPRRPWAAADQQSAPRHRHRKDAVRLAQARAGARGHGMVTDDILTWEEEGDEMLVMGLRLREGIDPRRFHQHLRPRHLRAPDQRARSRSASSKPCPTASSASRTRAGRVLDAVVSRSRGLRRIRVKRGWLLGHRGDLVVARRLMEQRAHRARRN